MELLLSPTPADWLIINEKLVKHIPVFNTPQKRCVKFFIPSNNDVWVPRWFASQCFKVKLVDELKKEFYIGCSTELMETVERPQQTVFSNAIQYLQKYGCATIVLPCGTGKTNIAISIAVELGIKTAILCHSNLLIKQWQNRLHELLTPCRLGIVQQNEVDTEEKNFVICSIPSLVSRKYDPKHLRFGLVIVDEAHHIPAYTFFGALKSITCKYTLGLTATPKRKDKLEDIIYWSLGPVCYHMQPVHNTNVQVNIITFISGHQREVKYRDGRIGISKMITCLTKDILRNKLLISLITKLRATGRKGLLLSDRVDHLKHIHQCIGCSDYAEVVTGQYQSDKSKVDKLSFPKALTLSTYHLFSEAIDFGGDFIILATPKSNVQQAVGRILRGQKTKHRPAVFDIVDPFSIFSDIRWKRQQFYKAQGFEIVRLIENVFI